MKARPDLEDYESVARDFATFLSQTDAALRPLAVIQNGHVGSPGISDLDFILVVDDDFTNGFELFQRIHRFIGELRFGEILFAHPPYLVPRKLAESLASYSWNDPRAFVYRLGDVEVHPAELGLQHILQQHEFLAERITIYASLLSAKSVPLDTLLLFGHALVHSQQVIGRFLEVDCPPAPGIDVIEEARRRISSGEAPDHAETSEEILHLLITDALELLTRVAEIISSRLHFYMGEALERIAYSDQVLWRGFSVESRALDLELGDRKIVIDGLPRTLPILRSFLFAPALSARVIADRELSEAVDFRRQIVARSARFNLLNFGNARGRGILACYAAGGVYDALARELIAALRPDG